MSGSVGDLISRFAKDIKLLFGNHLSQIIVYGSYARGDYTDHSDIDVMILVKTSEDGIRSYLEPVSDCAFEYLIKYGIDISPVIKNEVHFNDWVDYLPYYRNIKDEGLLIHAG